MIDTTAIRAEWEPRRILSIYGVEFLSGDTETVIALCNEIDALRKAHALQVEADNARIARLQDAIVDARARAETAERSLIATVRRYTTDWQRAEDALVAAGVEMFEHDAHLTIEDGIARLAERSRADGLAIATLMEMTGAASPDDLVRVVGAMVRATRGGASNS
jgi:hypothetical protein